MAIISDSCLEACSFEAADETPVRHEKKTRNAPAETAS